MLLLVANAVFYVFAGCSGFIYISVTILSAYFAARRMNAIHNANDAYIDAHRSELSKDERKALKAAAKRKSRLWLVLCLVINFGILAVLKYANFAISLVGPLFTADPQSVFLNLALPMGISFYTLQMMGYLIDVHRGKYPAERNVFRFALFGSFFPLLVQGPISRFDALSGA
jgi:hypothetical protein